MLDQANDRRALRDFQADDQIFAALTSSMRDAQQASVEDMLEPTLGLLVELQLLEQFVLEIERELDD
ncbi:MAG TPA: hypothetical protein VIF88_11985 [Methylocystis sp.]|jgi:hypothetical protein